MSLTRSHRSAQQVAGCAATGCTATGCTCVHVCSIVCIGVHVCSTVCTGVHVSTVCTAAGCATGCTTTGCAGQGHGACPNAISPTPANAVITKLAMAFLNCLF